MVCLLLLTSTGWRSFIHRFRLHNSICSCKIGIYFKYISDDSSSWNTYFSNKNFKNWYLGHRDYCLCTHFRQRNSNILWELKSFSSLKSSDEESLRNLISYLSWRLVCKHYMFLTHMSHARVVIRAQFVKREFEDFILFVVKAFLWDASGTSSVQVHRTALISAWSSWRPFKTKVDICPPFFVTSIVKALEDSDTLLPNSIIAKQETTLLRLLTHYSGKITSDWDALGKFILEQEWIAS